MDATDPMSVEDPRNETINLDVDEDGNEDLASATPLKKYVKFLDSKKGSACKWMCNFGCRKESFTGSYSRIRAHLIGLLPGQKAQGIALCSKVSKEERESMKKEEAEARKAFGGKKTPVSTVPKITPLGSCTSKANQSLSSMFKASNRSEVDSVIARCFYANGIPFNVARSPFWHDMIRAVNEAPKGYKPPSAEKIRSNLLDKEKSIVETSLMPIKEQWSTYGVSIVSDGWTNIKNQSLINVMAVSGVISYIDDWIPYLLKHGNELFQDFFDFTLTKRRQPADDLYVSSSENDGIRYVYKPEMSKDDPLYQRLYVSQNSILNKAKTQLMNKQRMLFEAKNAGHFSVCCRDE